MTMNNKIDQSIQFLEQQVEDPNKGLPLEIFYFVSRITPMVNVDLLIKDEDGRTLLSWRDDNTSGTGWHIPGGIIRYKETFFDRLKQTALSEIGTEVQFEPDIIAVNQIMIPHENRGHFISFLFKCFLTKDYVLPNDNRTEQTPGYLAWHKGCPENLIEVHEIYRKFI